MINHGIKPWLLPRADAPRAELMDLTGQSAGNAPMAPDYATRFAALACAPARRHSVGGRPDPGGDLIA